MYNVSVAELYNTAAFVSHSALQLRHMSVMGCFKSRAIDCLFNGFVGLLKKE